MNEKINDIQEDNIEILDKETIEKYDWLLDSIEEINIEKIKKEGKLEVKIRQGKENEH